MSGIISGSNVFAVLPTGFGKSLCYACLPTVFNLVLPVEGPSIVLVVGRSMPWVIRTALPCEPLRVDLKLLWLHGGITKTLDGFCRSVEHSLVHVLVCCRSWTEYDKYFTPSLQSDWASSYCCGVYKSMY